MQDNDDNDFVCSNCNNEIGEGDDFCPHCGAIFAENVVCERHPEIEASGACIVCAVPCCDECGMLVNDRFLCNRHSSYEIFEGMVRVYTSLDEADTELAKGCLEEAGLHPVVLIFRRPRGGGHLYYMPYVQGDDVSGQSLCIKVMVPCAEVSRAEEALGTLGNTDSAEARS